MNSIGRQYTAEMLEMYDMSGVWSSWNHAVLLQNLSHNLIKSEFHVKHNLFSSIKFEITMNLKVFHLHFDFDCRINVNVNNQNKERIAVNLQQNKK
jgi:hypothetical protein